MMTVSNFIDYTCGNVKRTTFFLGEEPNITESNYFPIYPNRDSSTAGASFFLAKGVLFMNTNNNAPQSTWKLDITI